MGTGPLRKDPWVLELVGRFGEMVRKMAEGVRDEKDGNGVRMS